MDAKDNPFTLRSKAEDPLQAPASIGTTIDVIAQKDGNVVVAQDWRELSQLGLRCHKSRRAYISEVAELYFGEREAGLPPRTHEELRLPAWRGVQAAIVALLRTGRLAEHFPGHGCPDSPRAIIGTDENHFYGALQGEHPTSRSP